LRVLDFIPEIGKYWRRREAHPEKTQDGFVSDDCVRRPFDLRGFQWRNPGEGRPAFIASRSPAESTDFECEITYD